MKHKKKLVARKQITKITENFEIWFSKNKPSLSPQYIDYVFITRHSSKTPPLFFKAWAKTIAK